MLLWVLIYSLAHKHLNLMQLLLTKALTASYSEMKQFKNQFQLIKNLIYFWQEWENSD